MKTRSIVLILVLALAVAGCNSPVEQSEATVILTVSDFDGLPVVVSTRNGPFQIDELVLRNIPESPTATTSELQSIELRSYEVSYTRRDSGTRVPPALVQSIFNLVPVGGQVTLNNLPFMLSNQIGTPPLSDLRDFGADRETGTAVIVLNASIRFFGRTLSGDNVISAPATFTIEVRP